MLLLIFSAMFIACIAYGYYNLFLSFGAFVAFVFGLVAAAFAWFLARWVGEGAARHSGGRWLFAPLLVVSATGVYNTLMLYLEGEQILVDTTNHVEGQFAALEASAGRAADTSGAAAHVDRVHALSESLFSEIRNPLNCGQGPEARRLIAELQRELPGFTPLSAARTSCAHNAEVIADYRERINGLVAQANWPGAGLIPLATEAAQARQKVGNLRAEVTAGYSPGMVRHVVTELEAEDSAYRDLRFRLMPATDVKDLPPALSLSSAQSLGNPAKVFNLLLSRLDQVSTYVYLLLALGFDLLMCSLFYLNAQSRVERQPAGHFIAGGW